MEMKQQQQMNLITMNNGFHKFGDIFFYIGVLWVLLYGTYGVAAVGTIAFLEASVGFLQIPLSAIIEQQPKKRIYLAASCLRIVSVVAVGLAIFYQLPFVWIALGYFIHEVTSTLIGATNFSYTIHLFGKEQYRLYQTKSSTLQQTLSIVGMGIAGTAYFIIGGAGMLMIELSMCVLFLLIVLIGYQREPVQVATQPRETEKESYWTTMKGGIVYASKNQKIMTIILIAVIVNMLFAPMMQVVLPIVFFEVDGELASVYNSIVNSCLLIGMVGLGIILLKVTSLLTKVHRFLPIGVALISVFLMTLMTGNIGLIVIGAIGAGIGMKLNSNAVEFLLVNQTDPHYLARVGAIFSTFGQASSVISIPLVTYFLTVGDYRTYCLFATIIFGLVVIAYLLLQRQQFFGSEEIESA